MGYYRQANIAFRPTPRTARLRADVPAVSPEGADRRKVQKQRLATLHDRIEFPAFSKDGCHFAYAMNRGPRWFIVVDGQPGPEYDGIIKNAPTFRPGGTLEYLAHRYKVLYRVRHLP